MGIISMLVHSVPVIVGIVLVAIALGGISVKLSPALH